MGIKAFDDYVRDYDDSQVRIRLKKNHSYRVMRSSIRYALALGWSKDDVSLAGAIGLLHDIGRFEQVRMFDSFSDKNIDHAVLGVKILFEDGLIENFSLKKEDYDLIRFSILNHNKFVIDACDNERYLRFAKLIRDVDKVDILYLLGYLGELDTKASDCRISDSVLSSIRANSLCRYDHILNVNDEIALKFAFAFDINYDVCLKELKDNLFYFYQRIGHQEKFYEVFSLVNEYIDSRLS